MSFQEMFVSMLTRILECMSALLPLCLTLFAFFVGIGSIPLLILAFFDFSDDCRVVLDVHCSSDDDFTPKEFFAYIKQLCSTAKQKIVQTFGRSDD